MIAVKRVAIPGLAAGVLALAACGPSSPIPAGSHAATSSPSQSTGIHAGEIRVVMQNILFNPEMVHAKVGQTIVWINRDDAPHNVTYQSGPRFTSSNTFDHGGSFTLKLTTPGTIRYVCTIHPGMDGTIVVRP